MLVIVGVVHHPNWPVELLACPDHIENELRHMQWMFGGQDTSINTETLDPGCDTQY